MVAILPAEGVSLSAVVDVLAESSIIELVRNLNSTREQFSSTDVMVHLPRFNISSRLGLNAILRSMGVHDIFDVSHANLSAISAAPLFVSGVLHQTEIEVDEEGTTGSSATVVEISDRISDVEYFKADRPFAFIVYDKINKVIIFSGIFAKPQ